VRKFSRGDGSANIDHLPLKISHLFAEKVVPEANVVESGDQWKKIPRLCLGLPLKPDAYLH
jgi:hypothetical protein